MRGLGSSICTTPYCACKAKINTSNSKSYSCHVALVVSRRWVSVECLQVGSLSAPVRCSTICPTENIHPEADNAVSTEMVVTGGETSGGYDLGNESSSLSDAWRRVGDDGSVVKLHFLEERDAEVLSRRIVSLSRSNRVTSAMELYLSMEKDGLVLTSHACNSLIACLLRNRSVDDALRLFDSVKRKDVVTGHSYSLILKAVAAERGADCALRMFLDLNDEGLCKGVLDIVVYNTMLTICGKARNWREAERMWTKLKEHGLQETRVTYCLLISNFVRCGQADLALNTYHEMIQKGFGVDEDSMKAIIAACSSEGRWVEAVDLLKEMIEKGSKVNVLLFNAVINCLGKAGKVDLAFEIFDLMRSCDLKPDTYTWNALLTTLYRVGRYDDCLRVFSTVSKKHGSNMTFHLFNTALLSCQKLGLWNFSLQILWQMESCGVEVPTSSYNLVLGTCESARKPKTALQVYQHMIEKNCVPDSFTFLIVIRSCIQGSLWDDIRPILKSFEPDASIYNLLVQGLCWKGNITLAKKLYTQMGKLGFEADGKTKVLMLQCTSKESRLPSYARRK